MSRYPIPQGGHHAGEIIGKKELTEYLGQNKFGHHTWMWKCHTCGETYGPSTYNHITRGQQCNDCARNGSNHKLWSGYGDIPGVYINVVKQNAHKRGIEWDVTPEYIWALFQKQEQRCAYTGWTLIFGYKSITTASLDRIDSSKGYIEGNVQWVHKSINKMKSNLTEQEFITMCQMVTANKKDEPLWQ